MAALLSRLLIFRPLRPVMFPQLTQDGFPVQRIAPYALRRQDGEGPVNLPAGRSQRIHLIRRNSIVIQHHARTEFHDHVSGAVRQRPQDLSLKGEQAGTGYEVLFFLRPVLPMHARYSTFCPSFRISLYSFSESITTFFSDLFPRFLSLHAFLNALKIYPDKVCISPFSHRKREEIFLAFVYTDHRR